MGGIIEREEIRGLPVGGSATLDILISELLDGAITDITEPQGRTLPYLRRKYLPPEGADESSWPWQKKLEELLTEDNGFFRIEVSPGHEKHFIDEGTHRLPFYLHEMVPRSGGALSDLSIATTVAKVSPEEFGMHSVNRAAGKPQALCFRFLPVLQMNVCNTLESMGFEVFKEGNLDNPIKEIDFEFIRQILTYLQNVENRELDGAVTDDTDKRTPGWIESLPWGYRDTYQASLKAVVNKLIKSKSDDTSIKRLLGFSKEFEEPVRGLFEEAVRSKLDPGNYSILINAREEINGKARLTSLLNVAVKRELFERFISKVESTIEQVSHLPISTLQGYNDIIVEIEKGAAESGQSLNSLLNILGGRSYGSGKDSYGPARDSYLEMPSSIGEPDRTKIISHLLDVVYGEKMRNRGSLRRDTIRRIRAAWTAEPYDKSEFIQYLKSESIERISAYLPLSGYFQLKDINKFIRHFERSMSEEVGSISLAERADILYAMAEERASRCREMIAEERAAKREYEGSEPVEDTLIEPSDRLEVLLESAPPFSEFMQASGAKEDPKGDDKEEKQGQEPKKSSSGTSAYRGSYVPVGEADIPLPRLDSDYLWLRRGGKISFIAKVNDIDLFFKQDGRGKEVIKLYSCLEDAKLHTRRLPSGIALNLLPDWDYIVFPSESQLGIATLIGGDPSEPEEELPLEVIAKFSHPLIIEPNMILPDVEDPSKYPYDKLWLVNLGTRSGPMAEVAIVNAYDPIIDSPCNAKCLLKSRAALADLYSWANEVNLVEDP